MHTNLPHSEDDSGKTNKPPKITVTELCSSVDSVKFKMNDYTPPL